MKIEYRTGNMFFGPQTWLLHQANARGVMGSGVAKELKERYPENYDFYKAQYDEYIRKGYSHIPLGTVIPFRTPDDKVILNLIGQENYGRDGKRYTSYDAIASGMELVSEMAAIEGVEEIAMPLIGSQLGGGSWGVISKIIEEYSRFTPVVYLLDGVIPK